MADDIDIDEHDVLDNPIIKSIFPDLTVIKKEVLCEYDGDSSVVHNVIEDHKIKDFCSFDKDLTPLVTFPTFYNEDANCVNFDTKTPSEYKTRECGDEVISPSQNNNIMLRLKPKKILKVNDSEERFTNVVVRLINIGPYLDNCKKYCKICFILFSNEEEFEVHKKSFHNLPVINGSYKNLNYFNCDKRQQHKVCNSNKLKCHICQKNFESLSGLYKHKRNIHFIRTKLFTRQTRNLNKHDAINIPIRNNAKVSINSSNHCFHCNASFSNMQSLIEHLYDTLQMKNHKLNDPNKKVRHINDNLKNQFLSMKSTMHQNPENSQMSKKKNVSVSFSKLFFYRCLICSFYYNNLKFGFKHVAKKHKLKNSIGSLKRVVFDPKCKFCSSEFKNIERYNSHIRKVHKTKFTKLQFQPVNSPIKSTKLSGFNETIKVKQFNNVSVNKVLTLKEIHKEGVPVFANKNNSSSQSILKSALFRCNRCDVHFLHSQVAIDHTSHMEILINWKCSLCNRIFKKNDELLHMQQHLATDGFTVYGICDTLPTIILYNCPKCSVHFGENIFLQHFTICGTVILNSHTKCKLCGILLDNKLKFSHADHHKKNLVNSKCYIIVQTEVLNIQINTKNNSVRDNFKEPQPQNKQLDKKWLKVYYCDTCKCFVNNGRKFWMHKKCNCTHVRQAFCLLCGLIISQTSISSHKRVHERKKNLKMQDFKFYDIKNSQLIYPPIPEFPQCHVCGIYFGNLITKIRHDCGIGEYITCSDCNKNFSELGYKMHMYYHNYRLHTHNIPIKTQNQPHHTLTQKKPRHTTSLNQVPMVAPKERKSIKLEDAQANKSSNFVSKNDDQMEVFIYSCKNCNISVTDYDSMIEHCQEHYNPDEIQSILKLCKDCNLTFNEVCYQNHINIHKQNTVKTIKVIKFDINGFMSKYDLWIKRTFDSFSEEHMQNIVNKSIYKFENKIKMQVIQEGNYDSTLYKCDQCKSFIDPCSLFKHFGSQCLTLKQYFCSICEIPFVSVIHKTKHEAIHKQKSIDLKSFKIVLFNRYEDKVFNESLCIENWFTLFKCRNCDGVVNKSDYKNHLCNRKSLKKCTYCGLLLYHKVYDLHIHKHKEFGSFNSKKIKVILIGNKSENEYSDIDLDNDMASSFNGKVYDYIYYKCKKCQICIKDFRNTLKHNCSFQIPSSKCTLCGLYFEARKFKSHYLLHESDNNFTIDNITLTDFDHTEFDNTNNSVVQILETKSIKDKEIDDVSQGVCQNTCFIKENLNENEINENAVTLYKCNCGLHFLENDSLIVHRNTCNPKTRVTLEKCSKCGLTFSPKILFTHLLKHHGNTKKKIVFKVIDSFNE